MVTQTISGELFLLPNDSNRDLGVWFALFYFYQVLERASGLIIICGTGTF